MRITITGATGFIGKSLIARFLEDGHSLVVLARKPFGGMGKDVGFVRWDAATDPFPREAVENIDAVVHLAGEPVAQRWTSEAKQRITASRLNGTHRLVEALAAVERRPATLVSASAIGYYGSRGDETLTEESSAGTGFLAETCVEWEKTACEAASLGVRVVPVRIGIVLSPDGGALARMLPPFKAGVAGRLGSGRQWMSWIHRTDLVDLIRHAVVTSSVTGAVNATAPNPVTNREFTEKLSRALHRPAVIATPGFVLKLLFGEMAEVLLSSQRVLPEKALARGFQFQFPALGPALSDLLR